MECKSIARAQRYRAIRYGLKEHFTASQLFELLASTDYTCMSCGASIDDVVITVDHVVPVSRGGDNTINNIQILCKPCNQKKSDNSIDYRTGIAVHLEKSEKVSHFVPSYQENRFTIVMSQELHNSLMLMAKGNGMNLSSLLRVLGYRALDNPQTFGLLDVSEFVTHDEWVNVEIQPPDKP